MRKNFTKLFLPLLLIGSLCLSVSADESFVPAEIGDYLNVTVTVLDVTEINGLTSLSVETSDGGPMVLRITDKTVLLDASDLAKTEALPKAGDKILAAYRSNMPMILIYPPQISPDAIILLPEDISFAKVDTFSAQGLSSDGKLKLNISEETVIEDLTGSPAAWEEAVGKPLAVFYSITTRSLPPQTSPIKILVLPDQEEVYTFPAPEENAAGENTPEEGSDTDVKLVTDPIYPDDSSVTRIEKDGVSYIRLSDAAALLGYDIAWNAETRSVSLTKGLSIYVVTVGETMYDHHLALGYFTNAPFLLDGRTFVEADFLRVLAY